MPQASVLLLKKSALVAAGFVSEPELWKYSSAIDYSDGKGVQQIDIA